MSDTGNDNDGIPAVADDTSHQSTFYEQLVEHVFISEVLQEVWYGFGKTIEVLRSEVDASGYDVVFECDGILRHVQLKTSKADAKTSRQNVNTALAKKPSGCVVWIVRQEDQESRRMKLSYRFFGGKPGEPLPSLEGFSIAKHNKGDAAGTKKERPNIRVVPKSKFLTVTTTRELVERLFGVLTPIDRRSLEQLEAAVESEEDDSHV